MKSIGLLLCETASLYYLRQYFLSGVIVLEQQNVLLLEKILGYSSLIYGLTIDLYRLVSYTKINSLVLVDFPRPSRLPKAMGRFF